MSVNTKTWQQELAEGFGNTADLCHFLELSADVNTISSSFPLRVPYEFASRMQKGNANDPLLKQVLPVADEENKSPGFVEDPVGDVDAMAETGVIHKYQNRVLFIMTGSCAINCRYCFRRNFSYSDFQLSTQKIDKALAYIANDTTISEVILSGGDPLLLSDEKLAALFKQLDKIKHLKRIRIHSRLPIVLPSRVTPKLCNVFNSTSKAVIVVVHSNHQNELNSRVEQACQQLKNHDVTLLNQAVLLKGINDDAEQLAGLSEKLFTLGIMPYYLHLLDKARGTAHFEVDQQYACVLMNEIKQILPGYLVPKLVREQAGAANKILIA